MGDFIIEDGVLKRYTGPGGEVTVPDGVVEIGAEAFLQQTCLERIELPSGLRRIGARAFADCERLKEVRLPDGLRQIDDGAFARCSALTGIVLPDTVTQPGVSLFAGCTALRHAVLPKGLSEIPGSCFRGCVSLESVVPPEAPTGIEYAAFEDCSALRAFPLPSSLCVIGNAAFMGCNAFTDIVLPDRLVRIEADAFHGCEGLRTIVITKSVETVGERAFDGCPWITIVQAGGACFQSYLFRRFAATSHTDEALRIHVPFFAQLITLPVQVRHIRVDKLAELLEMWGDRPSEPGNEEYTRVEVRDPALLAELLRTELWAQVTESNAERILADPELMGIVPGCSRRVFDRLLAYAQRTGRTEAVAMLLERWHGSEQGDEELEL